MNVFGYIFLAVEKEHLVAADDQQAALCDFGSSVGMEIGDFFVEHGVTMKRPFIERNEGSKLLERCALGDVIITMKSSWVLGSASEGANLLQMLRERDIALYCMDIGENISVDEKRKLMVYEGCAGVVQKLLSALALCESSRHGEAIRATKRNLKKQGKYIGGPVPFGWEVNKDRFLVQNRAQQKIIQAIITMREDRWSYRDISKKLKDEYDIQLSHAGVRRVLDNDKKKKVQSEEKDSG
ncbi:MAG: recombinase family protein [Desulforhopalus sp.]